MEAVLFISIILGIWFLSRAARECMAGRKHELRLAHAPERILRAARDAAPGLQARRVEIRGKAGMPLYSVTGSLSGIAVRVDVSHAGDVLAIERLAKAEEQAFGRESQRFSSQLRLQGAKRGKRRRIRKSRRRQGQPDRLSRPGCP